MESALPILLFLGCLFAGMILILAMGIVSREKERAELAKPSSAEHDWIEAPRFFSPLGSLTTAASAPEKKGSAIARLEHYLETEQRLAAEFVAAPSVRKLYVGPPLDDEDEDPLLDLIEQHLRREQDLVSRFIAEPSIERLHEQQEPQYATA